MNRKFVLELESKWRQSEVTILAILWVIKKPQKSPTNLRKVSPQPVDSQLDALFRSESESRGWTLEQQVEGWYASGARVHWT